MSDVDDQVTLAVTVQTSPVAVAVAQTAAPVAVAVQPAPAQPVNVMVANGPAGPAGANAQIQVLSLAAYLALPPAQQMDGTWYVIPK